MSGGVDSSVAAAMLLEQGHDVTGVTMQLWPSSDEDGGCCSVSAVRDAKRVCDLLGIPHYALNYRSVFEREVVDAFADEYARGRTPNPCIVCNDRVKFGDLLAKVVAQGADFLATGHYARIVTDAKGEAHLSRGADPGKDQSYFLYRLSGAQASHLMFPLGGLHKTEVRAFARRLGMSVSEKPESQETCFAVDGDYLPVVRLRHPEAFTPGEIVDESGGVLGIHSGLASYTVGQRKGIGIGGARDPLYVLAIDAPANRVIVGPAASLGVSQVVAEQVVWKGEPIQAVTAMVRYRMQPREATARFDGSELCVTFDSPIMGVAPGQSVVCYREDIVVGGGVISCAS
jgi:tRNA-specific 2-thiouridylase